MTPEQRQDPLPLLVVSCDAYADLWAPFFSLFFRHWPDCPYRVYLGTSHKVYPDSRVVTIPIGQDRGWATSVNCMLDHLGSSEVLLFLEDFLLERPVKNALVQSIVACARADESIASIRLAPFASWSPDGPVAASHPSLRIVVPGRPYRVSAQIAFWRTSVLRRFLVSGFDAWQFEEIGSQMSDSMPEVFLESTETAISYEHGVERGRWKPRGLEICREGGVPVDLSARSAFSPEELEQQRKRRARATALYQLRQKGVHQLVAGARLEGWRILREFVRQGGNRWHATAFAAAGLAGPPAIRTLLRWNLRRRIRNASEAGRARARVIDRKA
jgi:hypothetical protein